MNRKYLVFIIMVLSIVCVIPSVKGLTINTGVGPGTFLEPIVEPNGLYIGLRGSYTANGTIDFYITENGAAQSYYMINKSIPDYVLWGKTNATSGSFSVIFPNNSLIYYTVFGNRNGTSYISIQYEIYAICTDNGGEIPGFGIYFILASLVALVGILQRRKKMSYL